MRFWLLPGIHNVPADVDPVPPIWPDFSHKSTSRPSSEATSAAVMPAGPAPAIRRSTSMSALTSIAVQTSPQFRRSLEIFRVLDKRVSVGHPGDVVADAASARRRIGDTNSLVPAGWKIGWR